MSDDLRDLIRWATQNGWDVRVDSKGYSRFHDPNGNFVAHYPARPSNPYRRMMDLRTALKRAGLQIPPPSKKEQRSNRRKGEVT
jgi:hypothetical protein